MQPQPHQRPILGRKHFDMQRPHSRRLYSHDQGYRWGWFPYHNGRCTRRYRIACRTRSIADSGGCPRFPLWHDRNDSHGCRCGSGSRIERIKTIQVRSPFKLRLQKFFVFSTIFSFSVNYSFSLSISRPPGGMAKLQRSFTDFRWR